MKRLILTSVTLCISAVSFSAVQEEFFSPNEHTNHTGELRKVVNEAFRRGEIISYGVHYGFLDAGIAVIQVKEENKLILEF